jgi:hypothetical protein
MNYQNKTKQNKTKQNKTKQKEICNGTKKRNPFVGEKGPRKRKFSFGI